jgi:hypothetical protein
MMSQENTLKDLVVLTGFSDADINTLKSAAADLQPWSEEITQMFYDTLFANAPTRAVFREGERPDREQTLRNWYQMVISGQIDDKFWHWQWYVGLIHIPRGITNPFMLGMMSRVQQVFLQKCQETFEPAQSMAVFGAFKRVTDVIAGLIAEGYFQSYVQAMERMSGQSRTLIDRMVQLEVQEMLAEIRKR